MNLFVSGGSGFIGAHLIRRLLDQGHSVTATGTRPSHPVLSHPKLAYIGCDTTRPGPWQEAAARADGIVNLAGCSIFSRWTRRYKQQIRDSRILTTRMIVDALPKGKTGVLCSTSAAGYYGSRGDDILTESSAPGGDFLAALAMEWETEARIAEAKGVRVVLARFGVVLGKDGGALKHMTPAFRMGLGGPLGNGKQWFPWVHIEDLLSAICLMLTSETIRGPVNLTAPGIVRNQEFVQTLGKALNRPALMPTPAVALKLALGEMADALLASQRVVPEKLQETGFSFAYPEIRQALRHLTAP